MSEPTATVESQEAGKRVSWVELYFDLIFVFAVSQVAHVLGVRPTWSGVGVSLGLFLALWWTWIGFVILYNRHSEDRPSRRLFVLAGTLPCAIAAVELQSAPQGQTGGFALALAATRLILAVAYPVSAGGTSRAARQAGIGYSISTLLFVASALAHPPLRPILWALALVQEAGFLLLGRQRTGGRDRGTAAERRRQRLDRAEAMKALTAQPLDPDRRLDAAHLAERFGLFMIILLGEIVVSVCAAAVGAPQRSLAFWLGLLAGLVLAAALWWVYFDSAARINEYVLKASNGNPALAYGIYAGGHVAPAFALLAVAAGVNLSLHPHPPTGAAWLVSGGLAAYLLGTRAFLSTGSSRFVQLLRLLPIAITVCLALLQAVLIPAGVVAVLAGWSVLAAAIVSYRGPAVLDRIAADPFSLFRSD